MNREITPYENSQETKKQQVARMFNAISRGYDSLNRIISMGKDVKWRKKVVQQVAQGCPRKILDVATGTGDLAIALSVIDKAEIIGIDLSEGMLEIGQKKIKALQLTDRIQLIQGDCENLPFVSDTFDAVTVAFGVRNFENLEKGLLEILRVLKKNGQLVVLETSVPQSSILKVGHRLYTKYMLPFFGKIVSGQARAYSYLSESAQVFPSGEAFCKILKDVGFDSPKSYAQSLQVATIYVAFKK